MGFVVPVLEITGTLRTAVTGRFVAEQWEIPGIVWLGEGVGLTVFMPTGFLWSGAVIAAILSLFISQ